MSALKLFSVLIGINTGCSAEKSRTDLVRLNNQDRLVVEVPGSRMAVNLASHSRTDVGLVRDNNEDNLLAVADLGLFVVCDGLGGHAAGEIASEIAVGTLRDHLTFRDEDPSNSLAKAIEEANHRIRDDQKEHPDRDGMATTLSALWVREIGEKGAWVGHIGDSRIYIYRKEKLVQLTDDHSPLFQLYREGSLDKEDLRHHPQKNLIERSLGLSSVVEYDIFQTDIRAGDLFLLCTDGLSDMVSDHEIFEILRSTPFDELCDRFLKKAFQGGGYDNISLIIVKVEA